MKPILAVALVCVAGCAPLPHGADAGSDASLVEGAPFDFVRNQILVRATIRGKGPYTCTVDTGANPSVIDLRLARELGLRVSDEGAPAEGIGGGEMSVHPTEFDVAVGEGRGSTIAAVAMDMSALSTALGRPLHCVLGQSWLGTRVVQVAYPAARLRWSAQSIADPEGHSCERFPMTFWMPDDLMPLVTVEVNGTGIPASIDTGSSGTLKLFPEGAAAAGVVPRASDPAGQVVGARGAAAVQRVALASLRLGPITVKGAQGTLGERNRDEPATRQGNLGNGLLKAGVLTLDYPGRQVRICAPAP